MKEDNVLAISFGEIAFLLLFAFAIIGVVETIKDDQTITELNSIQNRLLAEKDSLEKKLKGLPRCSEIDVYNDWLFTATIISRDKFQINNNEYTIAGILNKYKKEIVLAKKYNCRHIVKFHFLSTINADDYSFARKLLERYFYVKDEGAI